ncbi:MAG TPA: efflux RND transporter periplasmic adaptor subunit [Thermoanaerobaculia bacterium]
MRNRSIAAGLVIAAVLGCSRHQATEAPAAPPAKIEGNKVAFPPNAPQLNYLKSEAAPERNAVASGVSGRLAWDEDHTSRVFPAVSGRIVEILANPGQSVAAGAVLARVKSPEFSQAQADARKALADVKAAERALARARDLFQHGAASAKDVDDAEADDTRASSEKERAMATLTLYGGNTSSGDGVFAIRAPIGGVVVEKAVNPGQEIRSDQVSDKPLFVISDPRRLWLYLDVTEGDVAALKPHLQVVVRARAVPGRVFYGRVEVVGEGLDPTTRTIKARCLVDNSEKLLRAEMYVTADITSAASGVDVPTKAIFLKDNQPYVFIESAPGAFVKQPVTLGPENNGRSVVIKGVSAGQKVVTEGCLLLEATLEGESS